MFGIITSLLGEMPRLQNNNEKADWNTVPMLYFQPFPPHWLCLIIVAAETWQLEVNKFYSSVWVFIYSSSLVPLRWVNAVKCDLFEPLYYLTWNMNDFCVSVYFRYNCIFFFLTGELRVWKMKPNGEVT